MRPKPLIATRNLNASPIANIPSNPRLHSLARGQAWFVGSYDLERMIWSRTRPSQSDGGVIPNSLRSVGARSRSPASSLTPGLIFGPRFPRTLLVCELMRNVEKSSRVLEFQVGD